MQFHHHGYVSQDPRIVAAAGTGVDRPAELPDEMDVLIVGSGPAGMLLAAQMSQFPGITTRIIEKRDGRLVLGQADGWVVLPGTHSKWVRLEQGAMQGWRTYMTGELFALLGQHGTLAGLIGPDDVPAAFEAGLLAAGRGALSHAIFGCRAKVVTGRMPAAHARSYLSGLLIGAEWGDTRPSPRTVTVVAAGALASAYGEAARQHGSTPVVLEPRAVYLAALATLQEGMDK